MCSPVFVASYLPTAATTPSSRSFPRSLACMLDLSTHMQSAKDQQSRCWMWTRRKLGGGPHPIPGITGAAASATSYGEYSWEEQAFAEDSSGGLGGCVWPPRSYSCSFCKREFRSAQALGGHMNVHRRDRARLKLSPVAQHIEGSGHHPHGQQQLLHNPINPCSPMASSRYPPQVCALVYSNNISPNPCAIPGFVPSRSRLSPSRVSVAASPQVDNPSHEQTIPSPSFSAAFIPENRKPCLFSTPPSLSDHRLSLRILSAPELKLGINGDLKVKEAEYCRDKRCGREVEESTPSCNKRRRLDHMTTVNPLLLNLGDGRSALQTGVQGLSPSSSTGEIDLELRLGDPAPKVK